MSFDPYHEWLGIRPEEHPVDHYRLLGIARFESDAAVISNAADYYPRRIKIANDRRKIRMHTRPNVDIQKWLAVLGTENQMSI